MSQIPAARPDVIATLVEESEALEERMAALQADEDVEPALETIRSLRSDYRAWYARSLRLLPAELAKQFAEQRDGGMFSTGIAKYLDDPRELSVLQGDDGSFPLGRWQHPVSQVRGRLEKQRTLLLEASPDTTAPEQAAAEIGAMLRRIPEMLAVIQRRRPDWALAEEINDEADLQVVVEAVLRMVFDDVRPEDYVPSRGAGNSRVDFVLPEVSVVIETKMTRSSLTSKKLGEELLIDAGRYPRHPDCEAIVAFVYDPERRIDNPRGVERDLTLRTDAGVSFLCVIAS